MKWIKEHITLLVVIIIGVALVLPICINALYLVGTDCEILHKPSEWTTFWGSYLGAIISAAVAFIILHIQRKDNEKQVEYTQIDNEIQNIANRELQKNILKHQVRVQWLSELKIKLIDYYNSFHYIDLYNVSVLLQDNNSINRDYCIKKLHEIWSDKDNATCHIQMLFSSKTDDIENRFIEVLSDYDIQFFELLSDLTWYCHTIAFISHEKPTEYAKEEVEKFNATQQNCNPYRITKIIEKYGYKVVSSNGQIIKDRMDVLKEYNSATLWGNIKALVGYEQKLTDNIISDTNI